MTWEERQDLLPPLIDLAETDYWQAIEALESLPLSGRDKAILNAELHQALAARQTENPIYL